MAKRAVNVLITDLDNTLWDWVAVWHAAFRVLLHGVLARSGSPRPVVIDQIKRIHQRYRTSEYPFLLQELPCLLERHGSRQCVLDAYADVIQHAEEARRVNLRLYPSVVRTLQVARAAGTLVVAYTESQAFCTKRRLRETGADELLDVIYSAPDHDTSMGLDVNQACSLHLGREQPLHARHRHTPRGAMKPDATILRAILSDVGASPDQVAYVGDSKVKDMAMAQDVGVLDVWVSYGVAHDSAAYELLREVTHWSSEDVERERKLPAHAAAPTITIDNLAELLEHVRFDRFDSGR